MKTGMRLLTGMLLVGIAGLATSSQALEIVRKTNKEMAPLNFIQTSELGPYLLDRTFLLKTSGLSSDVRDAIPISGIAIIYLAKDGKLLGWSDETPNVETGFWHVYNEGRYQIIRNKLCFGFVGAKGEVCSGFGPHISESTAGNPFGLKSKSPAPFKLGRFGVSLQSVAKRLGL